MITHFIIISYDYNRGERVGWQTTSNLSTFMDDISKISSLNDAGFNSYATHVLDTDNSSWNSVKESDPFFNDVIFYKDFETFKGRILNAR